ncbi:phosphatidate phosphatase PAH2-like [Euphorbia lathyris]|uniref:phosphatidate phosphatase PAH2-like n=1 Tax=Euphorbia lathyris TaxID=212925 RepID=UPI0033142832
MYHVGRLGSYITRGVYTVSGPFHPFGGAVDIIVVEQPDGSFKSSPWYVRFGKFQGVLKAREKEVSISVNGVDANFHMYLDQRGEAYFLREVEGEEGEFVSSSSSSDETGENSLESRRPMKSRSCNYDVVESNLDDRIDAANGEILPRTRSRRSRIFGLVFGRRSMKEDSYKDADDVDGAGIVRVNSFERAEIAADLLDVKWSTNLATAKSIKDNASQFSASNTSDSKGDEHNGEMQVDSSMPEAIDTVVEHYILNEECGPCNVEMNNGSQSAFMDQDFVIEEASVEISSLDAKEQIVETISEISCSDTKIVDVSEAFLGNKFDEESDASKSNVASQVFGVSEERGSEEMGSNRIQSFVCCEKSENSKEESDETIYLTTEGPGEVQFCATMELLSEDAVIQQAEEIELETVPIESCDDYPRQSNPSPPAICGQDKVNLQTPSTLSESYTEKVSVDPIHSSVEVEPKSISSVYVFSNSDHPVEKDMIIGEQVDMDELQPSCESLVDVEQPDRDCDMIKAFSAPVSETSEEEQFPFSDFDDLKHGETLRVSNSLDDVDKEDRSSYSPEGTLKIDNPLNTNDESYSSQDILFQKDQFSDTGNLIRSSEIASIAISIPKLHTTAGAEDLKHGETLRVSNSLDDVDKEDRSSYSPEGTLIIDNPLNTNTECYSSQDILFQKDQFSDTGNLIGSSKIASIAISIPKLHTTAGAEVGRLTGSLPNMWSQIDNLGTDDACCPLSHSLDSNFTPLEWKIPSKEEACSINSDTNKDNQLPSEHYSKGDSHLSEIIESGVANPAVGDPSKTTVTSDGSWRIWPFGSSRSRKNEMSTPIDTGNTGVENVSESNIIDKNMVESKVLRKKVRANTPTSEELASLNLKEGGNVVTFTFSTAMLGKQKVEARIYLWKWNTRIVISDVDGTITKSDVLGQFMPLVGRDWSQTGVAHLFSAIEENGYQLLFLSARAISQAYLTRQFLVNLKQDGKALPDGPVVISPDGLFPSLFREVIRRAPHEFKIACLEDIKALFPSDCNPFYAGFGNRDTDEFSYLKVGIPKGKIFIINPKGEVAVHRRIDTKSYTSLQDLVHGMFPVMRSSEQEDFNSWNFWRLPPPHIDI